MKSSNRALVRTSTTAATALAIALLAFACTPQPGGDASEKAEPKMAPNLVLGKVDGSGPLALEEQRGKVVLVDLWATWCAPCIGELPNLQALSDKYQAEDFMMLGVVLESGDREEVETFLADESNFADKSITYPMVMGEEGTKDSFGPFLGYPTKYLVNREGRVVKRYFGAAGNDLEEEIDRLIRTGSIDDAETE